MIELATIRLGAGFFLATSRSRLLAAARDLGWPRPRAVAAALAYSQFARAVGRCAGCERIEIALDAAATPQRLIFRANCPPGPALQPGGFDEYRQEADGTVWGAVHAGHGTAAPRDPVFLAQLRQRLESRSIDEVMAELREKNAALDEHGRTLETRIAERTAELEEARRRAEAATAAKSQFLANMSHELRTPLNAILGYAQILRRDPGLSERQAGGLNTIEQSGLHLLTLINDLLDLAKIEAGKFDLYPAPLETAGFLATVADIIRVKIEEKGLHFDYAIAPDLPPAVLADDKRLRQVLLNLLGNAVKFTDRGHVGLAVECLSRNGDAVRLRFAVVDSGVGMAPEQLDAIFQPFEQVGDTQRRAGGTGLGLAISRQLVRAMSGEIRVDSTLGAGSRFWFELDLPLAERTRAAAGSWSPSAYAGRRRKILIVDDVANNRALLRDMLGNLGFICCEADDGLTAIDRVRGDAPDLVLMDMVMAQLDGLEAIRRIRAQAELEQLPIVVLSASADRDDEAEALAAGADAFLAKPLVRESLLRLLGDLLALSWLHDEHPPQPAQTAAAPLLAPPEEELAQLHPLALAGNMRAIREHAARLGALDERYRPFAETLQRLAQGFQSKAILALVESHLSGGPPR